MSETRPGAIEHLVAKTAKRDGRTVPIVIEQEPGAAGVQAAQRYTRHVLRGYNVKAVRVTGDKATRARPVAAAAENGLIQIARGRHTNAFLDELASFPHAAHDDCVDALAGAHTALSKSGGHARISSPHNARIALRPASIPAAPDDDPIVEIARRIGAIIYPPPPPGITTR